jgi:exodeoxyribonuclease VII large subunit
MLRELLQRVTLSVTELNEYANRVLMHDEMLAGALVTGEVSNFRPHASGHWYFTLKDEQSAVRCVMFRQQNRSVYFTLENGMHITVGGYACVYARDGQFQINVQTMQRDGAGALYERFEKLKAQLNARGMFDAAHKKPLPRYPGRIGVVTSPTGAAVRDIIDVARRRNPRADILIAPASVQGKGAGDEIAKAIAALDERGDIDIIIVGRGGGSIEDLWAFNEEVVANAIYHCAAPVISAVGHETDTTISDLVADRRAPTPSAAAELAVPLYDVWLQAADSLSARMDAAVSTRIAQRARLFAVLEASLGPIRLGHSVDAAVRRADGALGRINAAAKTSLGAMGQRIDLAEAKIEAYSVQSVLRRGYARVTDARTGDPVTSAKALLGGQPIRLTMHDGEAQATVEDVTLAREVER